MELGAAIGWLEDHIHYGSWAARSARVGDVDLSLDRMRALVSRLGNPQSSVPIIHVTGTNGKGSTSRMITRLLMAEGLRVGTYSSPHLAAYNERFRIDDIDIDDATLADLLTRIARVEHELDEALMPFEILTAANYLWLSERNVDCAVIEVGVLGRYDATNVGDGRVCVITNIGFDHTSGEGDWQMRITMEKAGIIKPGAQLVLGPVDDRFIETFRAEHPGAIWRLGDEIVVTGDRAVTSGRRLSLQTPWQRLDDIELPLHGAHQSTNCALAITAASAFVGRALDPGRAARGLAAVRMPARLEAVPLPAGGRAGVGTGVPGDFPGDLPGDLPGEIMVILDGAHNPDAARALTAALDDIPCAGRRTLVVGLLTGRDPVAMLTALRAQRFDRIVTCTPPTERACSAADLAEAARGLGLKATAIPDVADALRATSCASAPGDQILVTGSIYLVADARRCVAG